jgi:Na+-driven multidrug efflux pump
MLELQVQLIKNQDSESSRDYRDRDEFDKDLNQLTICNSFNQVARESGPMILTCLFFQLVNQMNIIFVGQLGDPVLLAGVGMGSMLINVFCFAPSQGLNGTIETFVARDRGVGERAGEDGNIRERDKKYKMCGFHLNRAKVIITLTMVPIFVAFFWADTALIALRQDATISIMARNYVVLSIPGIFALVHFDCRKRWL